MGISSVRRSLGMCNDAWGEMDAHVHGGKYNGFSSTRCRQRNNGYMSTVPSEVFKP